MHITKNKVVVPQCNVRRRMIPKNMAYNRLRLGTIGFNVSQFEACDSRNDGDSESGFKE